MKSLQEVVAGIKEKASAHEDAKSTTQRTVTHKASSNSWDCSQIEKPKKRRMRKNWRGGGPDGSALLERRRREKEVP